MSAMTRPELGQTTPELADHPRDSSWLRHIFPPRQRLVLSQLRYLFRRRPRELRTIFSTVAWRSIPDLLLCYSDYAVRTPPFTEVRLRDLSQAVRLRNRTSDFAVFRDVILKHQYHFPDLHNVQYIVDAGANIGLTSLYLLMQHRRARVIAIEPDPENFEVASRNLAPFGDRVHLVHAGLWSHESTLTISRGTFRDGQHWATQTLPATGQETDTIPAHTLQTLLDRFGFPGIDLLKMDIEGAELQVLRDGNTDYLKRTRCFAIECHGDDCEAAFRTAVDPHLFQLSTQSELLVARK